METISEIRNKYDFNVHSLSAWVKYFKKLDIDWDIYLESKEKNLQRDFVWTIEQKRELINSVIIGRHIPHMAFINTINKLDDNKDLWLIIDGKQRLSTLFDFIDNKFTIIIDDKEYLFSELPKDYQLHIEKFNFHYYVIDEPWNNRITDEQKINWFKFINFSGTPQDEEHLKSL